ncbi:MAG: NifB/NifX family molybdenum-iron cluster-binding protein [Methylocystaceae bacterium]
MLKIAMPINGELVNQHFGQSKQFIVAAIEDGKVVEQHTVSADALQHNHAGLTGLLMAEGVSLVITGGIGQPAVNALQQQGLQVIKGANGSCETVLAQYLSGQLHDQNVTCNHHSEHHDHH